MQCEPLEVRKWSVRIRWFVTHSQLMLAGYFFVIFYNVSFTRFPTCQQVWPTGHGTDTTGGDMLFTWRKPEVAFPDEERVNTELWHPMCSCATDMDEKTQHTKSSLMMRQAGEHGRKQTCRPRTTSALVSVTATLDHHWITLCSGRR